MKVSVLAIGSEILDGRVLDTNSQYISRQLSLLGLSLHQTLVCDDVEREIVDALSYLSKTSSLIVITGGLGPTTDDLTRESVAAFAGVQLLKDDASFDRLKKRYEARKRFLDPANEKQAHFPESATIIPNAVGTAEGFKMTLKNLILCSVPGVPKEMYPMFEEHILPIIKSSVTQSEKVHRRSFRLFGVPEATVGRQIQELKLPQSIVVSYRAAFPEIHVVLKSKIEAELPEAQRRSIEAIGDEFIFTRDSETGLPEHIGELLVAHNATVSVAESCTAGMLGMHLTAAGGSSRFFSGGFLVYSNHLKEKLLCVKSETLKRHGAVSLETAKEMAEGCFKNTGSTYGLSITGIAGPDGGTEEKPVGTFCVGLASSEGVTAQVFNFPSDRSSVRKYATYMALDMLRRAIKKISPRT